MKSKGKLRARLGGTSGAAKLKTETTTNAKTEAYSFRAYKVTVTTSFKRLWSRSFAGMKSDGGSKHTLLVIARSPTSAKEKAETHCIGIVGDLAGGCCEISDVKAHASHPLSIATDKVLTIAHEYVL